MPMLSASRDNASSRIRGKCRQMSMLSVRMRGQCFLYACEGKDIASSRFTREMPVNTDAVRFCRQRFISFHEGNAGSYRCCPLLPTMLHLIHEGCQLLTTNTAYLPCLVVRALSLQTDLIGGNDIALVCHCFVLVPVKTRQLPQDATLSGQEVPS